jgi:hypothetical protein
MSACKRLPNKGKSRKLDVVFLTLNNWPQSGS